MQSERIQAAARREAVAIDGISSLVWVGGADAVTFLDGLLSQSIAPMSAGEAGRGLLLEPNGKLRAPLLLLRGHDSVGLVCDAGSAASVIDGLSRFKIRVDVTIATDERRIWDVWGEKAPAAVPGTPGLGSWVDGDRLVVRRPFLHSDLSRLIVAGTAPPVPIVDFAEVDAVRIEVGEPRMGVDLSETVIPQEVFDVSDWVDFAKGCYLGQELVARIDSRGHVNRRLAGLILDELPTTPNLNLTRGEHEVGLLTSSAYSFALNTAIGLAILRREVEAGAHVEAGGISAVVADLPLV